MRLLRLLQRVSVAQVAERARLRARMAARRAFPAAAAAHGRRRAGPVPPLAAGPSVPRALFRPEEPAVTRAAAAEAARGLFRHLELTREPRPEPYPAPADVPLLWSFEHLYLEEVLDLALCGEPAAAIRLALAREAADRDPGPGGAHPYPEARRTASLVRALWHLPPPGREAVAPGAWRAAFRVRDNLERDVGGNHLLENGLALVLAGAAFAGPRARELLRAGATILREGARGQVLGDGAHYELSPMYHARVLRVLAEGGVVLAAAGLDPGAGYWRAVAAMCGFLRGILGPGGELPLVGDSVRDERLDARLLLRGVEEVLPFPAVEPARGDRLHRGSGFCILEDGDRRDRLLLDAGPVCPDHLPAHGQADTFSFELRAGGAEVVVDAGVFGYEDGPDREWSRATRSHSTVEVGGEDSSEVFGSFRIGRRAAVRRAEFRLDGRFGSLTAEHDGYRHRGVVHARLAAHLAPGLYLIADRVRGIRHADCTSRLHLGPGVDIASESDGMLRIRSPGGVVRVAPFGGSGLGFESGTCSPSFGVRLPTKIAALRGSGREVVFGFLLATDDRAGLGARLDGGMIRLRAGGREWTRGLA